MGTTMKEAIVHKGTRVEIIDSPIPTINDSQLLIRVVVSGSNPKDWKLPDLRPGAINQGDDIAGIVERVGANVYEFKPGDRVAAFHEMFTPGGSYAEFAVAWAHTTFHIPNEISFDEAAAIPLAGMTAAVGLYQRLGLPQPWDPLPEGEEGWPPTPLVIYGAASAVGFYTLQLARRSGIRPLICVAGRAVDYVKGFIDPKKGDVVIDYRGKTDEEIVAALREAAGGKEVRHALDAVSEKGTPEILGQVVAQGGKVTFVLAGRKNIPEGIKQDITNVGSVHRDAKDFGFVYFRYMARGVREGWFRPQRVEVVPGGLGGVQRALEDLKAGKASAVKYVFRIAETEGVAREVSL